MRNVSWFGIGIDQEGERHAIDGKEDDAISDHSGKGERESAFCIDVVHRLKSEMYNLSRSAIDRFYRTVRMSNQLSTGQMIIAACAKENVIPKSGNLWLFASAPGAAQGLRDVENAVALAASRKLRRMILNDSRNRSLVKLVARHFRSCVN